MKAALGRTNYLFYSFLEDKKVYNLEQAYWGRLVRSVARKFAPEFFPICYISKLDRYFSQFRR